MREKEMTRHEIEKRIVEMAEEIKRFYKENVPNGGALIIDIGINPLDINIYNRASGDEDHSGYIDVIVKKDKEVVSMGHNDGFGKYGNVLRTKDGEWKL